MKDFSNFERGDNVYELGGGVVPEIAEVFEHNLPDEPEQQNLYQLLKLVGEKPTLQDNKVGTENYLIQVTGSREAAVELASSWVLRSGVQEPLNRSLWSPDQQTDSPDAIIATGAMANWQDRGARLLVAKADVLNGSFVYLPVGNRVMNGGTEVTNDNHIAWRAAHNDELPKEYEYAEAAVQPSLEAAGYSVRALPFETKVGDDIAAGLFKEVPELLNQKLLFARVANAGIQLAVQFLKEARKINPDFDADPENPQVFVITDAFPTAINLEEAANAKEFQNPYSGTRMVIATAQSIAAAQAA